MRITEVIESWHAPGYRDPELILVTEKGEKITFRLSPQAFVQLHDIITVQQDCIDSNGHMPLDIELYPHQPRHMAVNRFKQQQEAAA